MSNIVIVLAKMNVIFIVLMLSALIDISIAVNEYRINEGASTSGEPTACEKCEIESYAANIALLITATDFQVDNLTDQMNNRFHELEAFHDEIMNNIILAEQSTGRFPSDQHRQTTSFRHFLHYINLYILEIFEKSNEEHHTLKLAYRYDQYRNAIVVSQDISLNWDDCLCDNYGERTRLNSTFVLPRIQPPSITVQVDFNGSCTSVTEISEYHIIPLVMISSFFQLWLSDEIVGDYANDCVYTLLARLKRSMQKLVIDRTRNTKEFPYEDLNRTSDIVNKVLMDIIENLFSEKMDKRAYNWLRGNIFLGPSNQGPFHPEFGRS